MKADEFNEIISRRFRTRSTKTFFANAVSAEPTAISHIVLPTPGGQWTLKPPAEAAFSLHVTMAPLPRLRIRTETSRCDLPGLTPGDILLFDLSTSPAALLTAPMESVRFHISQRVLDELSYECGQRKIMNLRPILGHRDPVLHDISRAILAWNDYYGPGNPMFLDYMALAFHTHITKIYCDRQAIASVRGGLASWQLRRACELMTAKLADGIQTAELAHACGLSVSHFAHAFHKSTGLPPHKWLMKARIERAKGLLENGAAALRDIALACGFSDQSHFGRVFAAQEGISPARWRRLNLS